MCEMCKLREETEAAHKEMEFRFVQFQVELSAGREQQAQECQDRITILTDTIIANLRRKASIEVQLDQGMELSEILAKAMN